MSTQVQNALVAFGILSVIEVVRELQARKTGKPIDRPTMNEHEVERFVSRELERIRAGVRG